MKKIAFSLAAACALAATAQTETRGRPGLVVNKAYTTDALAKDMAARNMTTAMNRVTEALDGHLSAAVAGSRKFTVLMRGAEMNSLLGEPTRLGDALQLRENDYAVFIKLDSFLDATDRLANNGTVLVKRRFQLSGQVTIVGGATAEVLDISNLQVEKVDILQNDNAVQTDQRDGRLDAMMPLLAREFSEQSFERLMGVAFPMKVLDVEDDIITINRGEGFLAAGDIVEVFGKARVIMDDDTGEEIKVKGKSIGKATVISVEPNYAQAKTARGVDVPNGAEIRKTQK